MNLRNSIYGGPHHSIHNIYDVMQNEVLVWSDQKASCLNLPTMQVKKKIFLFLATHLFIQKHLSPGLSPVLSWNRFFPILESFICSGVCDSKENEHAKGKR